MPPQGDRAPGYRALGTGGTGSGGPGSPGLDHRAAGRDRGLPARGGTLLLVLALLASTLVAAWVVLPAGPAAATGWGTPVDLTAPGQNAYEPQVAASADGSRATATWYRWDGVHARVQASSTSDHGATWSAPVELSAPGQNAFDPRPVVSADGLRVTIAWRRYDDQSDCIVQARSSADGGATWSDVADLSLPGASAFNPELAASADGLDVTVAWYRFAAGRGRVEASTSTDGGTTWGLPTELSGATGDAYYPRVAASADGSRLHVAWYDRPSPGAWMVQERSSSDGGATWDPISDLSAPGQDEADVSIATSEDGLQVTVAWRGLETIRQVVRARTSADGGATWSATAALSDPGLDGDRPQVVAAADWSLVAVVWDVHLPGGLSSVAISMSRDGGRGWTAPVDLSVPGSDVGEPQAAISADGSRVTTAWTRLDDLGRSQAQSRGSADGGAHWEAVADLTAADRQANFTQVAMSANGSRVFAAWSLLLGADPFTGSLIVQVTSGSTTAPGPLAFSPDPVSFPTVRAGQPTSLTVGVRNTGTADAWPSAITTAGAGVSVVGGSCRVAVPIPADGTCTVSLRWVPPVAGTMVGALSIAYPGGPTGVLRLTGTAQPGGGPVPTTSPTAGPTATATATPTPTPTGTAAAAVTIVSPAPGSAISSGGYFAVRFTTTGVPAGATAFVTLDGVAKARGTVASAGVSSVLRIPAEAGKYAVRIGGGDAGPVLATSAPVSLRIVPFALDGWTRSGGNAVFRVLTGNFAAGTTVSLTRDGVSAKSRAIPAAGQPMTIAVPYRPGTYQVRVDSRQGWVYGAASGVITLR